MSMNSACSKINVQKSILFSLIATKFSITICYPVFLSLGAGRIYNEFFLFFVVMGGCLHFYGVIAFKNHLLELI